MNSKISYKMSHYRFPSSNRINCVDTNDPASVEATTGQLKTTKKPKLSTDPASVEAATGQLKTVKKPKISTDPISVEAGYNRNCGMNCGWLGRAGSVQKQRQCDDALGL